MKRIMKRFYGAGLMLAVLISVLIPAHSVRAVDTPVSLIIDQIKITSDDQFVRLRNVGTGSIALSDYELIYFNGDNKPTKTLTFSGTVPKDGYFMLNDAQFSVCYQMQVDSVSLGFSTTAGSLQLWHYTTPTTKVLESTVAWIKTRKTDTPASIVTLPTQPTGILYRQWPAATPEWIGAQPSATDSCMLLQISDNKPLAGNVVKLVPGTAPPVNTVTVPEGYVTPKNTGMIAPVINEVLPNPGTPYTDDEDEFVELYNPNDTEFDLAAYKIIYGSGSSPRSYTFPEGTSLQPKSYTAFFSAGSSISLSNTSGQLRLSDPNGTVISQTEAYAKAKDNQSWALVNGKWAWMVEGTPNAPNDGKLIAPAEEKKDTTSSPGVAKTGSVKGAATIAAGTNAAEELDDAVPLHPFILVVIGLAAVGYAIYEYRHDIANKFHRFRRNGKARRETRAQVQRW